VTSPAKARALVARFPAAYIAIDLLAIGGVDLRTQRWTVRRGRLEDLATGWRLPLQLTPVTYNLDEAKEWLEVLPAALGTEGLVIKPTSSRYVGGRRSDWAKINSVGVAVFDKWDIRPGQQWLAWSLTVSDTCRRRCGRRLAVTPRGCTVGRCDGAVRAAGSPGRRGRDPKRCTLTTHFLLERSSGRKFRLDHRDRPRCGCADARRSNYRICR
jgi:hypothetical protein